MSHVQALAEAISASPGDRLATVRDVAGALEEHVFRAALNEAGWSLNKASRVLGVRISTAQRALARHPALMVEYQKKRK